MPAWRRPGGKPRPCFIALFLRFNLMYHDAMNGKTLRAGRILPLLLIPIGFVVYLYALRAPFVYDDRMYITGNAQIKDLWNFTNIYGTRWLGFLSFALNYRVSGLTPFDFHLTNVIIHIVNSLLVFSLIKRLLKALSLRGFAWDAQQSGTAHVWLPFTSALLFLVHPVQTQAVTYVTQRFASLAAMFYLVAVLLYVKARLKNAVAADGKGARPALFLYAGAVAAVVAAMKTKEISFTLPFALTVCEFIFFSGTGEGKLKRFVRLMPFYLTLLIIPLTLLAQGGPSGGASFDDIAYDLSKLQMKEATGLDRLTYFITEFRVIITYIRLIFFPVNQSIDYAYPLSESFFEPATFLSFTALTALFGSAVYVLFRSFKAKNPFGLLYAFGIFWFFLALSVESSLVPIQDVIFEQRVYLPSIGFFMALTAVVFYCSGRFFTALKETKFGPMSPAVLFLIASALVFSIAAYKRNFLWTDEFMLLGDAISNNPGKARLYYARGIVYLDNESKRKESAETRLLVAQNFDRAVNDFNAALAIDPHMYEAYNNRGLAYSALEMYAKSVDDFTAAIKFSPGYLRAYYNRGLSRVSLARYDDAIADFTYVIERLPLYAEAYNNRGIVFSYIGEREKAFSDLSKACGLGYANACVNLEKLKRRE